MSEPLDLHALEARLKFGDSLDAAECAALLAYVRALRAALQQMGRDGTCCLAAAVGKPCDEVCVARAVLAAATDGPPQ